MPKICVRFLFTFIIAYLYVLMGYSVSAAPPTCTVETFPGTFDSVTGVGVSADIQGIDQSETTLKWSASYGDITPVSPTTPVNVDDEIVISEGVAVAPNEFANPSFETTPIEFWSVDNISNGYVSVSNGEQARTGSYSLKLHKDTAAGNYYDLRWIKDAGGFYVEPGDEYLAEAWVYTQEVTGEGFGTLYMIMTQYKLVNGSWQAYSWPTYQVTEATGGWQKIVLDELVPADVTRVRLEFMLGGAGTAYIDDVYFAVKSSGSVTGLTAESSWSNNSQTDSPVTLTATVKNDDGQNTCSKTVTPTIPAAASAPTCNIRVEQDPLYSDIGATVFADVENYQDSTTKIRWSASYGGITPSSPSSPIDADGFITISEGSQSIAPNELENADMEGSDIRFWSIDNVSVGYAEVSNDEEARSGTRALKLHRDSWEGTDNDLRWIKDEGGFYVEPGNVYTAEVWGNAVPKESGAFGTLYMVAVKYRLDGSNWDYAGSTYAKIEEPTSGWEKLTITEEVPWEVTRVRLEFRLGGYGSAYFDDAYFSGNSAGSTTSFPASASWISSQQTDAGVTLSAEVKNSAGSNTCSTIVYPELAESTLKIQVKETSDTNKPTNDSYCTNFDDYSFTDQQTTANVVKIPSGDVYFTETSIFNSSYNRVVDEYPTPDDPTASYGLSLDISDNYSDLEIKCVRHRTRDEVGNIIYENIVSGSLAGFTATRGTTEELQVVLGPTPVYPWFQAYGGQIYSFGGIENNVPSTFAPYLQSFNGVDDGPVTSNGALVGPPPSIFVQNYGLEDSYIQKIINDVKANPSKVKEVANQANINPNNPRDIYLWTGTLPLVLDKDIQRLPNRITPIVFVDGDVEITSDVEELNIYLIVSGKITLQERITQEIVSNTNSCENELAEYVLEDWEGKGYVDLFQSYVYDWGAYDTWQTHKEQTFPLESGASFAVVEAYWQWSGHDDTQKGEKHTVTTPFGQIECPDYGDSELAGEEILCGVVSGPISTDLFIEADMFDLDQSCLPPDPTEPCHNSHRSIVKVTWCDDAQVTTTQSDPLIVYGGFLAKGISGEGIVFERVTNNFDTIDYTMEEFYFTPEIYWGEDDDFTIFSNPNLYVTKID